MASPRQLLAPHDHSWPAGGSGHGVTDASLAAIPSGSFTVTPSSEPCPSGRSKVNVKGL